MSNKPIVCLASLFLFFACNNTATTPASVQDSTKRSDTRADEVAIKQTVHNMYNALVYRRKSGFDTVAINRLFLPQAQFIHFEEGDSTSIQNKDQFMSWTYKLMKNNDIDSFIEEEVRGRTEQFGNIAHRFSSYKTYVNETDTVAQRGINSIQLIKTKEGWRIASFIWDVQHDSTMLKPEYLTPDAER